MQILKQYIDKLSTPEELDYSEMNNLFAFFKPFV